MTCSIMEKVRAAYILPVSSIILILSGCTSQNDGVSLEKLSTKGKGIVFIGAEFDKLNCYVQGITVGQKVGDHFVPTGTIFPDLPKELPAGEHYLNHASCKVRKRPRAYGLGRLVSGFTSGKALDKYAKFHVRPGKVTDVGVLSFEVQENSVIKSRVREHSPSEKAYKLKRAPRLYSMAETHLMTAEPIQNGELKSNRW